MIMRKKEVLVIPILIALLLIQLMPYLLTKSLGETVVFKAELYDPRDVFRGDYVALDFEQESVAIDQISLPSAPKSTAKKKFEWLNQFYSQKIYALLEKQDGVWAVTALSENKPKAGLYIECKLNYVDELSEMVHLEFDVERYYVEENTGGAVEDAAREEKLYAKLKVWRGEMVMTDLIME